MYGSGSSNFPMGDPPLAQRENLEMLENVVASAVECIEVKEPGDFDIAALIGGEAFSSIHHAADKTAVVCCPKVTVPTKCH
jgi:hypothetical protein